MDCVSDYLVLEICAVEMKTTGKMLSLSWGEMVQVRKTKAWEYWCPSMVSSYLQWKRCLCLRILSMLSHHFPLCLPSSPPLECFWSGLQNGSRYITLELWHDNNIFTTIFFKKNAKSFMGNGQEKWPWMWCTDQRVCPFQSSLEPHSPWVQPLWKDETKASFGKNELWSTEKPRKRTIKQQCFVETIFF